MKANVRKHYSKDTKGPLKVTLHKVIISVEDDEGRWVTYDCGADHDGIFDVIPYREGCEGIPSNAENVAEFHLNQILNHWNRNS